MSDWQPAIAVNVHGLSDPQNRNKTKVMIRETLLSDPEAIQLRIEMKCGYTSAKFYEVLGEPGLVLCEHEILTD